jgi:two-component system NtrC family sensor kinase
LQLLKEEVDTSGSSGRVEIIEGQLTKIEGIVKGFLQSTAKPNSQTQLVDLNRIADKTLGIVMPRIEALNIEIRREFDRKMGPLRVVPLDFEQILLNLINNSLDALQARSVTKDRAKLSLRIATASVERENRPWARVGVYDTGGGILKADLKNVLKPFFTTKRPGEGTGLGLAICQQLVHKYGGHLNIESKEGAWTEVALWIPYRA